MSTHYREGQHIKVRVTGVQSYSTSVETPGHTKGLIHISEIMDDCVHNLERFLSGGQIVKTKILSTGDEGKLNLSLKDNDYFKNYERKKEKQFALDEIRGTEKYGFRALEEHLPVWIGQSKRAIRNNN